MATNIQQIQNKIADIANRMKKEYDEDDGIEVLAYVNELLQLSNKSIDELLTKV